MDQRGSQLGGSKKEESSHFWNDYHWIISCEDKAPVNTSQHFVDADCKWYKFTNC